MPRLTGQVMVRGESPAKNATVELHNADGDVVDQVQVDDAGRYTYHLSPGTWRLRAWDAHGHRAQSEISLEGDDETLDLELQ